MSEFPYVEFLREHVQDILESLPTDGIFFDILMPQDCSCVCCRRSMKERGIDAADGAARKQFGLQVVVDFINEMTRFVRRFNDHCSVYYNSGHIGPWYRRILGACTHFDLESLPAAQWGFMHFPLTMRYIRGLNLDTQGLTSTVQTTWGDIHSFKSQASIESECFQMLALGAKPALGQQSHPSGKLCGATFDLIGAVFAQIEAVEAWCTDVRAVTDVAVLPPPDQFDPVACLDFHDATIGSARMLQEGGQQFDILDAESDLDGYKLLIMPDQVSVEPPLAARIERFLAAGGALIASHRAGLNEAGDAFALEALGVSLKGEAPWSPDFIRPCNGFAPDLPRTEHVMYSRGLEVAAEAGARVLADVVAPYFNRTLEHFSSHQHTPSCGEIAYPGIVRHGNAIYFAHPIFSEYQRTAPLWCKRLVMAAIRLLLPDPVMKVQGPSTLLTSVNEQPTENRYVVHLLHYIPERRCAAFDVIEDVIPVHDIEISVATPKAVRRVQCVPEGRSLEFEGSDDRVAFTLPRLNGHQMIAIEFA